MVSESANHGKLVVAVTDGDWFESLRQHPHLSEVNFWAPSAANFRALRPGELFLFKLHAPRNYIVGGGIFTHSNTLPCSLAWEAFKEANGADNLLEMRARIARYRKVGRDSRNDFTIGCRILSEPFFLDEPSWIPAPENWAPNIVKYKTYDTDSPEGFALWESVQDRMRVREIGAMGEKAARYGEPRPVKPRLGQGGFRVLITDNYQRRCAITQERTLPALDAAHIFPYGEGGKHEPTNGLLLRRDIHSLFDAGYVTVAPDHRFEVSDRIKEEFENGREYYALHGRTISVPEDRSKRPDPNLLEWHNGNRFLS